jgi:hypothetical protein
MRRGNMANENIIEGTQLSFGTQGKDVALLHQVLTAIGIEINEEELKEQRFGLDTEKAVLNLQRLAF